MKNQAGTTMLEILVVLTIIAILAAFSFGSIADFQKNTILSDETQELISAIKTAQNKSMSGEIPQGDNYDSYETDALPQYGINISGQTYTIVSKFRYKGGAETVLNLESHELNSALNISPGGSIYFKRISGAVAPASVSLKRNDNGGGRKINIERSGKISTEIL